MNIYQQKSYWKLLLLIGAIIIVSGSLWYSNELVSDLANEERKKIELWASAFHQLNSPDVGDNLHFVFAVIKDNTTIPVIWADEKDNILGERNLDSLKQVRDTSYLRNQLMMMKAERPPIVIDVDEETKQYVYYTNSILLKQLKYFPFVQFGIIGIFLLTSYLAFSTARRVEQNQVWVGLSKETAHQLGTPITSMMGWFEYLKEVDQSEYKRVLGDMEKDVKRLEQIANRFSKIGSPPKLEPINITTQIEGTVNYIRKRASDKVSITFDSENNNLTTLLSNTLFDWVIENLLKNALNAIEGNGNILVHLFEKGDQIYIDVKDTGKGVPSSKFKTVFKPGYTTRKRGWGLGLSLTKRIVEEYHGGKIFIKESTLGKGTTFRITLPKTQ